MSYAPHELGRAGEAAAAEFLTQQGFEVLARGIVARPVLETGVPTAISKPDGAPTGLTVELFPVPGKVRRDQPLGSIPGTVPRIGPGFAGCGFRDRCAHAMPQCAAEVPWRDRGPAHGYLCQLPA